MDFVQSKSVFPQRFQASVDFVQSSEADSSMLFEMGIFRWRKSSLDRNFPVFRSADWIKSIIGYPYAESSPCPMVPVLAFPLPLPKKRA